MRKVAAITNPIEVRRYLQHVNMDYEPPARAPLKFLNKTDTSLPLKNEL
jgi:hypothetical protein